MSEQLRLEQRLGDRCAIDADERLAGARARAMNRACDHFLPGSAFARDQNRRIVLGDARHEGQRLAHRGALGDQPALRRPGRELRLQSCHLLPQALALLCFSQRQDDFVWPERLREIVVRACFHRGDRGVLTTIGAHHDHQRRPAALAEFPQKRDAIHLGHADVAEDQIEWLGFRCRALERTLSILLRRDGVTGVGQEQPETLAQAGFIVHDQDALHSASAIGKNNLNAAPPSRAVSTHTTPPMSKTDLATMARPRPVPRPGSLVV